MNVQIHELMQIIPPLSFPCMNQHVEEMELSIM